MELAHGAPVGVVPGPVRPPSGPLPGGGVEEQTPLLQNPPQQLSHAADEQTPEHFAPQAWPSGVQDGTQRWVPRLHSLLQHWVLPVHVAPSP